MADLISLEKISLKNHPNIKEDNIQQKIFASPNILGLGDLLPIQRERVQPAGGRLDILLSSSDNETRYEVEIQLGATDPSHIIRTIEYWDVERRRYPQYNHCAVIVAEEITGRFMNVINLFNGSIPIIALQMNAYKTDDKVLLTFTKVIDKVELGNDEEDVDVPTDRKYWTNRSTEKTLKTVESIFQDLNEYVDGFELSYTKHYIGLSKDNIAKNFISFKPRKSYLYILTKGNEDNILTAKLEDAGLEVTYESRWNQYRIKLTDYEDYQKHKELLTECISRAKEYYNLSDI